MSWTSNATKLMNDWLINDPVRAQIWQAAATDFAGTGRPLDELAAELAVHMRLHMGHELARGELPSPWCSLAGAAVVGVNWLEIAEAFLIGAHSREPVQ